MGCFKLHNYHLDNDLISDYTPKLEVVRGFLRAAKLEVATKKEDLNTNTKYYPYGMLMPGRFGEVANSSYAYGFNGMEKDDEVKGSGNHLDFGARMYDSRLGRWFSIDAVNAAWQSPYVFVSNDVVRKMDPDGNWERDGHYWTVLLMGVLLDNPDAKTIAYYTEYPDHLMTDDGEIYKSQATWMSPYYQIEWHAITGGDSEYERKKSFVKYQQAKTAEQQGYMAHRIGDSYAHTRMDDPKKKYSVGMGQGMEGTTPDKIKNRPELYKEYVITLAAAMDKKKEHKNFDKFIFSYVADHRYDTDVNADIMKAEYYMLTKSGSSFEVSFSHLTEMKDFFKSRGEQYGEKYQVSYLPIVNEDEKVTRMSVSVKTIK